MSFNRITVRAKKSVSGLFSFSNTQVCSSAEATAKDDDPLELKDFGSYPHAQPCTGCDCPETKYNPPIKDSPSRRKRILGSLRSFGSLRSVRSPPKNTKEYDDCSPPYETPSTPTRHVRPSLALNFEESPPGQPMFDLPSPRRSISSSLIVHQSSPMGIPASSKNKALFGIPCHPLDLPAGTIPDSPAPFQKVLDMESGNKLPSSPSSPALDSSVRIIQVLTPMPGTNLALEDVHSHDDLRLVAVSRCTEPLGDSYFPAVDIGKVRICNRDMKRDCKPVPKAGEDPLKELKADIDETTVKTAETTVAISSDEPKPCFSMEAPEPCCFSMSNRQIDDIRDQELVSHGREGSDVDVLMDNLEYIDYQDDCAYIEAETAVHGSAQTYQSDYMPVVVEVPAKATVAHRAACELVAARTATTTVPTAEPASDTTINFEHRTSGWGGNIGLYDGTGYGGESCTITPRSSMATEESIESMEATLSQKRKARSSEPNPADDHETMEVILAYAAAYDNEAAGGMTGKGAEEGMESGTMADVELSNRMMNYSLGA